MNLTTQQLMLWALQRKPMYLGTAPEATVQKRREANRVARKQRRVNRQRGA